MEPSVECESMAQRPSQPVRAATVSQPLMAMKVKFSRPRNVCPHTAPSGYAGEVQSRVRIEAPCLLPSPIP